MEYNRKNFNISPIYLENKDIIRDNSNYKKRKSLKNYFDIKFNRNKYKFFKKDQKFTYVRLVKYIKNDDINNIIINNNINILSIINNMIAKFKTKLNRLKDKTDINSIKDKKKLEAKIEKFYSDIKILYIKINYYKKLFFNSHFFAMRQVKSKIFNTKSNKGN